MNLFAHIVLLGWIPAVMWIFSRWSPQRAMIACFVIAWLYLPQAGYILPGIPDYTKMNATCYGILIATGIFDIQRFKEFRPSWVDIPIAIFCIAPFVASMTNGLGPYDGMSTSLDQIVTWGMPYFLGRLYLSHLAGLRDLAMAIFIGGLSYIPFCLVESRLSPQFHRWVYGFHAHDFVQTFRLGGFRPTVFMYHGLMVAAWMMTGTLTALWMWRSGCFPKKFRVSLQGKLFQIKPVWLVASLGATFVILRSTGVYFLLALALLILYVAFRFRSTIPLFVTMLLMCLYLYIGAAGYIGTPQRLQISNFVTRIVGAERAQSLDFRLMNEEVLGNKARQALMFGWGGWGRSRVRDPLTGKDITVTDSLWIIVFGQTGLLGLVSMATMLVLPILIFWSRFAPNTWGLVDVAPAAALMAGFAMFGVDCLLNAQINPVFILISGALNGLVFHTKFQPQLVQLQQRIARRQMAPRNFL